MKRKFYLLASVMCLSIGTSFSQFSTTIPNLEAYYPLDGNLLDSSGNNYHLGANTGTTFSNNRFEEGNKSLLSNSTKRYYKSPIDNFPEFSFGLWVYPLSNTPSKQVLLGRTVYINDINTNAEVGKGGIFELFTSVVGDSMTLNMSIHYGQSPQQTYTWEEMYTATKKIAVADWSHVGLTYSSTTNNLKMYVNGLPAGEAQFSTPTNGQNAMVFSGVNSGSYNLLGDMIVGGATVAYWNGASLVSPSAAFPFEGFMDDFYIFSRAITPAEMLQVKTMQDPSTASISENNIENSVSLYPNPANTLIQVKVEGNSGSYSIFGTDSREILKGELTNGENQLDIHSLATGTYFFQTSVNGAVVTKQFVKQ
ncbi:MAG: T9SS type A sorting domain-containing protein [Flavobacteriales bacterium]|nr:T9SS type A sorting domain-containing protein [Flavobacteriales bacterium]